MASFFENQHQARRNTKLLVLMFMLAVGGVILAVDLVLASLYAWSIDWPIGGPQFTWAMRLRMVPSSIWIYGTLGTAFIIFAVSGWNVMKLASGGKAVAEMVNARRIPPGTTDPLERRLLNVVEEMAIASGVRVPAVYLMDHEPGINAFAAGFEASDSVVAVTRGTLEALNRDELQGVVAHEFSHILNGDMRLNIRMIGVLAGIVFIGSIGEFILRNARGGSDSKGALPIFLGGLALLLIGYIGLFFARLIKAAASRQREFLADASSVQFTRNPDGIAGALDQIRASSTGTLVASRHAEDLSHMFFCQGIVVRLHGLFDTHPPIEERISRVHAGFDRTAYRRTRATVSPEERDAREEQRRAAAVGVLAAAGSVELPGRRGADIGAEWGRSAGESAKLVGTTDGAKVDYAAKLLNALPPDLREKLREAEGARAAVIALLIAPQEAVAKQQLQALQDKGFGPLAEQVRRAELLTRRLGAPFRLPVVDLALPALKQAPEAARTELLAGLEAVIHADRRVSLHEFALLTLMRVQLTPRGKPGAVDSKKLAEMTDAVNAVLSLVAHAGVRQDAQGARAEAVAAAVRAGYKEMSLAEQPAAGSLTLEIAGAALEMLKRLAPMQKALLVKGLFATVTADGTIRVVEAELMRLVGAVLDCPLPPLLEAVDPATLAA